MSTTRPPSNLDEENLIATIETLTEQGETLPADGGILTERVAEELPFSESTIRKHCANLAAEGDLEKAWGLKDGRPTVSYLAVESRKYTTDENSHAQATAEMLANADDETLSEADSQ